MKRLPPLRLLATFEEIARLGSMREAAARLNVTRPAITQALKALEDHVGVALLDRTTRPARLTEAGQQLARATREGLGIISGTIDEIQTSAGQEQQLTIACTVGMATHWLMPRLSNFYAQHPQLVVNVQAPPTDLPALAPGIDVALRYGTGDWSDGKTWKLFNEVVCPVGQPALIARLLEAGVDLEEAPLIQVASAETPHWAGWTEYMAMAGRGRPRGPTQTFDNYVQAIQAARDGRGLVLGWRSITDELVREGHLRPWPGGEVDPGFGYHATLSPQGAAKAATHAFIDWLKQITA
ncbi:LysR substrate-binding domain-containing protein [Aquibaculum arenosum]|uniref:LysR substrate-binding domain-containing protein n=1 Tax=Aquibaculum arenosum TaxID=3032591 RepID=A0ABT5YMC5_9PROT|nr:LysR substrate-binding domain-containing protein [Fodinicurvata sp. CAU 1616]MDF2095981.1 LysR substrate-binding domain-containing protein [Fodinicurvata sp. CAU 1616]